MAYRLTDAQWLAIAHLFPCDPRPRFGRSTLHPREAFDAILWVIKGHQAWPRLPDDYPPWRTCRTKYLRWERQGLMTSALTELGIAEPCGNRTETGSSIQQGQSNFCETAFSCV
jgi:hypothetical protein